LFTGSAPICGSEITSASRERALDSGAAVSCLGGSLAQQISEEGIPFKKVYSKVSTADGHRQETVGKVCLTVVFDRRTEEIYIRHTYILYILSQLKTRFVFRDRFLVQIRLVTEFTKCV